MAKTKTSGSDINFSDENILLSYDNYAYNIKLSIPYKSEYLKVAKEGSSFNTNELNHIVVAQSGLTQRYSIDSLQVTNIPNGSSARNSVVTAAEVIITEAGSMRFMDDLFYTINTLGYDRDWGIPMIVEIDFVGYNGETGNPEHIPEVYRSWSMTITDIKMKQKRQTSDINNYVISLLPMNNKNDSMYLQSYGCENFQCIGDFGTVMTTLQETLNSAFSDAYPRISDLYEGNMMDIHYDSSLGTLPVQKSGSDAGETNTIGEANFSFKESDNIFTTIDKVINYISPKDPQTKRRTFVKVIPKSTLIGFDEMTEQYIYKYDIYIKEYATFDALSAYEIKNNLTWNDFTQRYKSESIDPVIKRYYHTYSGLNKEVISMELDFENTWHYMLSINSSSMIDFENKNGSSVVKTQEEPSVEQNISDSFAGTNSVPINEDTEQVNNVIMENFAFGQSINPKFGISFKFQDTGIIEGQTLGQNVDLIHNYDQMSMYYSTANLLQCKLKVIGDPRWLGYSDSELYQAMQPDSGVINQSRADFFRQESLIQIRINTAPTFDENHLQNRSTIFDDSIYKITQIISTFKSGKFIQDIQGHVIRSTMNSKNEDSNKGNASSDKNVNNGSAKSQDSVDYDDSYNEEEYKSNLDRNQELRNEYYEKGYDPSLIDLVTQPAQPLDPSIEGQTEQGYTRETLNIQQN